MTVKMTGLQFKQFSSAPCWKDGMYWDETLFIVDGVETDDFAKDDLSDASIVEIVGGTVYNSSAYDASTTSAASFARKWLKEQTTAVVLVTIAKDSVDSLLQDVKNYKGATAKVMK